MLSSSHVVLSRSLPVPIYFKGNRVGDFFYIYLRNTGRQKRLYKLLCLNSRRCGIAIAVYVDSNILALPGPHLNCKAVTQHALNVHVKAVSTKCRLQTRYKMQTADCRPGIKCRLSLKCRVTRNTSHKVHKLPTVGIVTQ